MNERIKQIRTESGLNQTDFAKRISVSRSAVCKMESGENSPSEQTIKLICREFSVNENWLRTGNETMFLESKKNDMISKMLGDVIKADESDFKRITNPFKVKDGFPASPQDFNIIRPKVDLLIGEETKRPLNFRVVRTSQEATSEIQEQEKQLLLQYIEATIMSKMGPEEQA